MAEASLILVRLKCVTWASATASSSSSSSPFVSLDVDIDGEADAHPQCCRSQAAVRVIGAVLLLADAASFSGMVGVEEREKEAARRCAAACRRRSFQCGLSLSMVLCFGSGWDDGDGGAADMCVGRLGGGGKNRRK